MSLEQKNSQDLPRERGRHSIGVIFSLWRQRSGRLAFGVVIAILALFCGLYLMQFAGLRLAGCVLGATVISTALLRWMGIGRVVLRYGQRLFAHDAMFRALADIRVWFFRSLAKGSAAGLGFRRAGDMLSRLVSDINALDGLYLRIVLPLACVVVTLPVVLVALFSLSIPLGVSVGLVLLCAVCVLPLCMFAIGGRTSARLTRHLADLRVKVLDLVSGLREVCVFGAGERMLETIKNYDQALFNVQTRQARQISLARILSFLCGQLGILFLLLGIAGVAPWQVSVLGGIGVLFLLTALFDNFSNLTQAGAQAGMMGYAARRVVEAAMQPAAVKKEKPVESLPQTSDLTLKDVSFRWATDRPWVLRECQFTLAQGEHVAIVGESGAGKSTIAALLLNVMSPQHGDVSYGGISMTHLDATRMRRSMAWLSQQTHIFADTVRANLLLADPQAGDEQLWAVLEKASIASFVKSLPDGLDSWLGEGGVNISGGQARRIALARTLLMDAPIVILDEPTSGLDNSTATEFLRTLNDVLRGKSVLYITHQFYGVEKLDRTLCLTQGQLVHFPVEAMS